MDAILAIFRIAIIATIVVTGIHICFFPQLPQLQRLLSSGVNCIFFRIAIIATIVMERDPYIFLSSELKKKCKLEIAIVEKGRLETIFCYHVVS